MKSDTTVYFLCSSKVHSKIHVAGFTSTQVFRQQEQGQSTSVAECEEVVFPDVPCHDCISDVNRKLGL